MSACIARQPRTAPAWPGDARPIRRRRGGPARVRGCGACTRWRQPSGRHRTGGAGARDEPASPAAIDGDPSPGLGTCATGSSRGRTAHRCSRASSREVGPPDLEPRADRQHGARPAAHPYLADAGGSRICLARYRHGRSDPANRSDPRAARRATNTAGGIPGACRPVPRTQAAFRAAGSVPLRRVGPRAFAPRAAGRAADAGPRGRRD